MHFEYADFDGFEFRDRTGTIRTIYGCSTLGLFNFHSRVSQIWELLEQADGERTWQDLFMESERFRHLVHRCLELNGIDPDWVTLPMVEALLFHRFVNDTLVEGFLVTLNRPNGDQQVRGEPTTEAAAIAAIATHTDIDKALQLADTVPAKQLHAVLKERNKLELQQTEEGRKQLAKKRNRRKSKQKLEEMRKRLTGSAAVS